MASRVSVATRRAVIRRFTAISLFAVLLLAPTAADAALIHIDSMAGFGPGLVPELSSGGQRLEIVGYSRIFDNPCNNCPIPLAVGDTLVVDVFFNFTVLMSDTIGFDEMFRAYLVGNPSDSNPDVSSVLFSSRVSLATENGPLSFDMQAGGLRQVSELQSSSVGDMVPTGAPIVEDRGVQVRDDDPGRSSRRSWECPLAWRLVPNRCRVT